MPKLIFLKLFLYFLKRKLFLYFQKWNAALFSPSSKNKKIYPGKISYTSENGNSKKKSYIFSKESFSYISGNRNSKKLPIYQRVTCKASKSKTVCTFPYKDAKFSKLKYFFTIIIKCFFSFYNIFFYTQEAFVFHLLRDSCNHIATFFLLLL